VADLANPFDVPRIGISRSSGEAQAAFDGIDKDENKEPRPNKRRNTPGIDNQQQQ
jgi:hypothetical protein